MNHEPHHSDLGFKGGRTSSNSGMNTPILAEDMLLLLIQPLNGRVIGERNLPYVLAGAILTELVLDDAVAATATLLGNHRISAIHGRRPGDELLGSAWDYLAQKPRGAQTSVAALGSKLREPLMSRLQVRGDVRQVTLSRVGTFPVTALETGASMRRSQLVTSMRAALVEGAEPTVRTTALIGLLSASQALPLFEKEIPWNSTAVRRAKHAEKNWGTDPVAQSAGRIVMATVANTVTAAKASDKSR